MEEFYRIRRLPPYVFEQVNRAEGQRRATRGADIIDLGMGNPDLPTPAHIIDKLIETRRQAAHRPLFVVAAASRACAARRPPITSAASA